MTMEPCVISTIMKPTLCTNPSHDYVRVFLGKRAHLVRLWPRKVKQGL